MCDYSLHHVATRPAVVGDKIVSTNFIGTVTRGFADADDRRDRVAVCLLPGTELAFEKPVAYYELPGTGRIDHGDTVARFRQVDTDKALVHHDALEFPDGKVVLLTVLCEGQSATVLQLGRDMRAAVSEARSVGGEPVTTFPILAETV